MDDNAKPVLQTKSTCSPNFMKNFLCVTYAGSYWGSVVHNPCSQDSDGLAGEIYV